MGINYVTGCKSLIRYAASPEGAMAVLSIMSKTAQMKDKSSFMKKYRRLTQGNGKPSCRPGGLSANPEPFHELPAADACYRLYVMRLPQFYGKKEACGNWGISSAAVVSSPRMA